MDEKPYLLTCKRCGRQFYSRMWNALYCDIPSANPRDKGRTCKQLRRKESQKELQKKREQYGEHPKQKDLLMTEKFGILTREAFFQKFNDYLMEKYQLSDQTAYESWKEENIEIFASEYGQFTVSVGLRKQKKYKVRKEK